MGGVQKPCVASSMKESTILTWFELVQDILVVLLPTCKYVVHGQPISLLLWEDPGGIAQSFG